MCALYGRMLIGTMLGVGPWKHARQRIPDTCGATAVVVVICDKTVYVCWAGDSEAALFSRDGSERHLCVVHKAGLDVWALRPPVGVCVCETLSGSGACLWQALRRAERTGPHHGAGRRC